MRIAVDNVNRGLWSPGVAADTCRSEFDQLLPGGQNTPGFSFLNVVDDTTGSRIGEVWYSVDTKGGKPHFWIHWITVDPRVRRQRHATQILERLEILAGKAGADRLGLHVLADNEAALGLYQKLGYTPTSLRMAKRG